MAVDGLTGDYANAWAEYRRRRRVLLVLTLLFLPGTMGVAWVGQKLGASEQCIVACAVPVMLAWFVAGQWLIAWRCPRCGRRYFQGWYTNPLARRCVHCGLPRWANFRAEHASSDGTAKLGTPSRARYGKAALAICIGAFFGLAFPAGVAAVWMQVLLFGKRDAAIVYGLLASHTPSVVPSALLVTGAAWRASYGSSRACLLARLAIALLLVALGAFMYDALSVASELIDNFGKDGAVRTAMKIAVWPAAIATSLPVAAALLYLFFALKPNGSSDGNPPGAPE